MAKKAIIKATFMNERVLTEDTDLGRELYNQGSYGAIVDNKVQLSLVEALYLIEKKRLEVVDGRNKIFDVKRFIKRAQKIEQTFWIRYCVFKDMRDRGYVIKPALKFGADFAVYDRGVKPGEDHAKWIVYPVHESTSLTWYEFAAKNRVAHSTKKRLLVGIVGDRDVTYYEIRWVRP